MNTLLPPPTTVLFLHPTGTNFLKPFHLPALKHHHSHRIGKPFNQILPIPPARIPAQFTVNQMTPAVPFSVSREGEGGISTKVLRGVIPSTKLNVTRSNIPNGWIITAKLITSGPTYLIIQPAGS